jgi:hypothetical protein
MIARKVGHNVVSGVKFTTNVQNQSYNSKAPINEMPGYMWEAVGRNHGNLGSFVFLLHLTVEETRS